MLTSSRAPKAPPTPARCRRTFVERERQAGGDLVPVDVQPLGGDVEVDAAVLGGDREPRLGAHERLVLHAGLVAALDHDCPGGVRVAAADRLAVSTLPSGWIGSASTAALGVDEGLRRRVVDDDRRGGAACGLGVVGGHGGDGLSHVADDIAREDRLVGVVEPVGLAARARRRR